MLTKNKITLDVPSSGRKNQHFSFRLKSNLNNELAEYGSPSKMFIVADIEGNFYAFCKLLMINGVIDKYFKWTFDDGHMIVVGDCFDRGEQVIECLWLIYSLEEKARKQGGHVHFILGNHEIMNLNGDWRYMHPKYINSSKTQGTALYHGNYELWCWLCTKNIIEKIGNTLFVHAGISMELLKLNLSASEINNLARPYYIRANELFSDHTLYTIFSSEHSPFWYRGYYQQGISEEQVEKILSYFGVSTIVTGHTVVEKVSSFFNGNVINVDTDHASGNSEALLIKKDRFYRIDKDGKRYKLK